LPALADAPRMLQETESELENGFGFQDDDSLHVAIRTEMPGVSPAMIDWWFGWHGSEPQRYKLWHPRAHLHAQWADGGQESHYLGRVSFVDEYIGSTLRHAAIHFLPPAELGFDKHALAAATAVCARVGLADSPVDAGYLVHHVRRIDGGSEMRSRFWLGGKAARVTIGFGVGELAVRIARRVLKPSIDDGRNLLVHCSQEMSHLASFLPRLHAELSQ
jgi:hypothetical protein